MPDSLLVNLPAAALANLTDYVYVSQNNADVKMTLAQVAHLAVGPAFSFLPNGHYAVGPGAAPDMYSVEPSHMALSVHSTVTAMDTPNNGGLSVYTLVDPLVPGGSGVKSIALWTETSPTSIAFIAPIEGFFSYLSHGGTGRVSGLTAVDGTTRNDGSGDVGSMTGAALSLINIANGSINTAYGVDVNVSQIGTGTIDTAYGIHITIYGTGISGAYGLFIDDCSVAAPAGDGYNLWSDGANSRNYFGGAVTVGNFSPLAATKVSVYTGADTNKGLVIKANSNTQTASLLEVQTFGGSTTLAVGAASLGFFGAAKVVKQANASQAGITAVTDANARAALQAIYNLLQNYGLAPATT